MSALDQILSIPSLEAEHPRLHTDAYLELRQTRLQLASMTARLQAAEKLAEAARPFSKKDVFINGAWNPKKWGALESALAEWDALKVVSKIG